MSQNIIIPKRQSEITQEITITDTYTMKVGDRAIIVDLATAKALTLPPVRESAGHVFSIFGLDVTGHAVTITENSEDVIAKNLLKGTARSATYALNTDEDYAILYSDGFHWHLIASNTA